MAKTEHAYLSSLKTAVVLLAGVTISGTPCPSTSPYHLVPKHLRTMWSRPEQSHLLPEACFPDGTDKRRQHQRQTERPPPEPSDILKRFYALYDDKLRNYKKKVSKLYCLYNPFDPNDSIWSHWIFDEIKLKNRDRKG